MDRDLQALLMADNPWILDRDRLTPWLQEHRPAAFLPRRGVDTDRWLEADRAHLVIGPRQAGKSTLIWDHLAQRGEPALFVDCEQPLVQAWCRTPPPLFLADVGKLVSRPVTLFFDEVQHLDEAGLFFKGLVDRRPDVPILVTGSSSYHLGARTRESLAGRATRSRLLPFAFEEVSRDLEDRPELVREALLRERLERHLVVGGYPEVWLSERPETLLAELVESIVLRDASDLFQIQRPDAFRRLLRLLAGQVGSPVNLTEWASILGIDRHTVASYLEILESGHVVAGLSPYVGGKRAELTSRPKVYLVDNGIRHRLTLDFKPFDERVDRGAVLEGWVFSELWKALPVGATLHFWRSANGAEVDFVVVRGDGLLAVEVEATPLRRATLRRSARSFLDAYRPDRLVVVSTGLVHRERIGETEVQWIRPEALAGIVREVFSVPRARSGRP